MHTYILVIVWFVGAGLAGIALFFPVYNDYLIVSSVGWATIITSSALIFYEMKRIKAEDRKKELPKS